MKVPTNFHDEAHCDPSNCQLKISQISPKSSSLENLDEHILQTPTVLTLQSSINDEQDNSNSIPKLHKSHHRIERSALPILNEIESDIHSNKISSDKNHILDFNPRPYHNFDIKPTQTFEGITENAEFTRTAKDLDLDEKSFLLKGDPRLNISGSPITPTAIVSPQDQVQVTATASPGVNNNARQNANPDIQDIITGIVKLLNGNVNVHANTQLPQRRPVATRINNRGPPRISEAQPIPVEYEGGRPSSNNRPPAYAYDRHDRPYITGVPIPEQVVPPTFQQNFRPGFVSQNSNTKRPPPPWHTNRRQPITGSGRRPIPQYKPLPPAGEHHSEENLQSTTIETENNESPDVPSIATVNSFETDFPSDRDGATGNGVSSGYIGVGEDDDDDSEELENLQPDKTVPKDKEDLQTKKKIHKPNKTTEKSEDVPVESSSFSPTSEMHLHTSEDEDISFFIATTSKTSSTPSLESVSSMSTSVIEDSSTETASPSSTSTLQVSSSSAIPPNVTPAGPDQPYHPRPGIVLDDPEFKPGGQSRPARPYQNIQPTRPHLPPGYGEIFDVTLSAIQGPGGGPGTNNKQTINITPYGIETSTGTGDVIIAPTEDDEFVSIDGKRTYINLFGEATQGPTPQSEVPPVNESSQHKVIGTGYAVPEVDITPTVSQKPQALPTNLQQQQRPHYRPRTTQPPVRIDTCIVGDDSTCDQAQNERCRTENGVSSCHCRPGYSRRKHREPCRRVVSFFLGLRVDKIYEHKIVWSKQLLDSNSEQYGKLSYESIRAIDSAMSMTPFSDEFLNAKVNNIYSGDPAQGMAGVFVNMTLKLDENAETLRPSLKNDVQKHLLGVIHRRNNNIGNSVLYVESPAGAVSSVQDLNECMSSDLNDCHEHASCTNFWGSFKCTCDRGFRDPWADQIMRSGRECNSCPDAYCNNRGMCSYSDEGLQVCECDSSHYGSQCEIDGEVLGVAIGASVAAIIIIVLTFICLIMWSKRWQREQKNAMGSPVFGYLNAGVKTAGLAPAQPGYQVTLEDRMRWAQIADVMSQANHYGAEPIAPTRPSSAMFAYPSLHGLSTLGGMSISGTLPLHHHQSHSSLPQVPLPSRLSLGHRNGMRTLENSSSSEEEDRTDLLGRNFQVPRPKSRSNASIANQSGIYYDVDYEPSGNDYNSSNQQLTSHQIPGPQGIPLSTYTSGRAPSSYYMK
ncbi:pwn family protein [Megaselia abdita]